MRHTVALDDAGRVVEGDDVAGTHRAEERATRSEHDGNGVRHDLVDEPESQRLTSDLPGGEVDDPAIARERPRPLDRRLDPLGDGRERGGPPANFQSVGGWCVTTKTCSPAAGTPPHPSVMSNSRRPITIQPTRG